VGEINGEIKRHVSFDLPVKSFTFFYTDDPHFVGISGVQVNSFDGSSSEILGFDCYMEYKPTTRIVEIHSPSQVRVMNQNIKGFTGIEFKG
jgi:hypothetical protein